MEPVHPSELPGTVPIVFGVNQPEYRPLPARTNHLGRVITEWEISEDEHRAIVAMGPGRDFSLHVRVHQLTANKPLQPIRLELVVVPAVVFTTSNDVNTLAPETSPAAEPPAGEESKG